MVSSHLEKLLANSALSESDAASLIKEVASGTFPPSHIAAFLTAYKMRSPTVQELYGFRQGMLELATPLNLSAYGTIDLCGTGGDGKNTFNISTTASFIVAGAGVPVAKHGNYSASSNSGSSNVLEFLKVPFAANEADARRMIEEAGITFLHAPRWHPAMKNVAPVRKELGIRTVFNLLGPLVNPSQPKKQLVGVSTQDNFDLYSALFDRLQAEEDIEFCVVHSLDGYDEISLTGEAKISYPGSITLVSPQSFGLSLVNAETLNVSDVASSAKILVSVLEDHDLVNNQIAAPRQVALANAALALKVSKPQKSLVECVELASESLKSGRALDSLKTLQGMAS